MKPSSSQSLWSSESVRKVSSRRSSSYRFTVNYLVTTSRQSAMRLYRKYFMEGFIRTSVHLFLSPGSNGHGAAMKHSFSPGCPIFPLCRRLATPTCALSVMKFFPLPDWRLPTPFQWIITLSAQLSTDSLPTVRPSIKTPALDVWFFLEIPAWLALND